MSPVEMWGNPRALPQQLRLRTLAGAGRAEQNQMRSLSLIQRRRSYQFGDSSNRRSGGRESGPTRGVKPS